MLKYSNVKMNRGFTILEVIIALFVLTLGAGASLDLIQKTITFTSITASRAKANYLLAEGIEIVKNIRDTNWLEQYYKNPSAPDIPWDEGLPEADWEADYKTQNLNQFYVGNYLKIDADGFYSYSAGQPTKFKRKIRITKPATDIIEVFVQVQWQERGMAHSLSGQENLYNWFK